VKADGHGAGTPSHVKQFDGQSLALLESFYAFDAASLSGAFIG
jgi:hypothetical protein